MKKLLASLLLLLPLLYLYSCGNTAPSDPNTSPIDSSAIKAVVVNPTLNEYQLDLIPHELEIQVMNKQLIEFNKKFQLKNRETFKSLQESVKFEDLIETLTSLQSGTKGYYFSGVWVNFTITDDNSMKYYFSPALSSTNDTTPPNITFKYQTELASPDFEEVLKDTSKEFYEIINNELVKTSGDTTLLRIAVKNWKNYKSKIQVKKNIGIGWRNYEARIDTIGGDGICVYFPMQELYSLWFDNGPDSTNPNGNNKFLHIQPAAKKSPDTARYSHYVNLYCSENSSIDKALVSIDDAEFSTAYEEFYGTIPKNIHIAKSDEFVRVYLFAKSNFHGMAADYGQLCPTRCKDLTVVKRRITQ